MNLNILDKSYDVRWIYPSEINEEFYYKIWRGFWELMTESSFAVWYDARLSSEFLKDALIKWILDSWKNVIDIGLCSTDMIYFSSGFYTDVEVGIMITASHNPKEYNWIKCCQKFAVPINMKDFWKKLRNHIENDKFNEISNSWTFIQRNITDDWVDHILSFIDTKNIKPLKVVADAWNWVAGVFMEKLAEKLWIELIPLFFEPDWRFPNHHPSPIEPENMEDLIRKVLETWSDLWVAFDGDADRMYICDEKWEVWSGTITSAMISKVMLQKNPNKKIVYNAVCGNIVPETIVNNSWIPLKEKVGHVYIKEKMNLDPEIIFWTEHSGHYYFRKNWNADSGVIAFVIILELLSLQSKKPSETKEEFEIYYSIDEKNSKVESVSKKLAELKEIYKDWEIDELDWLTIRFEDYWFNVRPSSNEPLLRLNIEAKNKEILYHKEKELLEIIKR